MIDLKGVKRGYCFECGIEECDEFIQGSETKYACAYCGHPPAKHFKCNSEVGESSSKSGVSSLFENEAVPPTERVSLDMSPEKMCSPVKSEDNTNTGSNVTLDLSAKNLANFSASNLSIMELPKFSACVEAALSSNDISGPMWSNFIMQTAAYYINFPEMCNRNTYNLVGQAIFKRYPSIERIGYKPWSHFTRCLSQKIRNERLKKKSISGKNYSNLTSANTTKETNESRMHKGFKAKVYLRSKVNFPKLKDDEYMKIREKISIAFSKKTSEKAMIKALLRESFHDRTNLLNEKGNFIEEYPCFTEAEYFIYEFGMLIGRDTINKAHGRIKEFFMKIRTKDDDPETSLRDWIEFEKKTAIHVSTSEKTEPIVKLFSNNSDFLEAMEAYMEYPNAVALMLPEDEKKIKEIIIRFKQYTLIIPKGDLLYCLTVLLSIYYTFELNYPKKYLQVMGALGWFVLEDKYYKLGARATRVMSHILKK